MYNDLALLIFKLGGFVFIAYFGYGFLLAILADLTRRPARGFFSWLHKGWLDSMAFVVYAEVFAILTIAVLLLLGL